MNIKIKAGKLNNLSDARFFSTFSEWLGLNCDPVTNQSLDILKAKEIMGWVAGPRIIGELGGASTAVINQYATQLSLDSIEINNVPDFTDLYQGITSIYYRIALSEVSNPHTLEMVLASTAERVAAFVLTFEKDQLDWQKKQPTTTAINLSFLQDLSEQYPIILSYPFTPQNILPITQALSLQGIELAGGEEMQVGLRSFDDLEPILETLGIW